MANILLLGHKGYLGSYIHKKLSVDVLDNKNVYSNGKKYDYVINCIGKPSMEYCEGHLMETNYANWIIIKDIIKYYPGSKIIHFSTYYVYDDDGLCTEESKTTDKYAYTKQKLNSEKLNKNGVTFRLGKLFGNPYMYDNKLISHILQNNDLVLDSVNFNPTSVEQVMRVIQYEIENGTLNGVYNLSNLGFTCPYELGIFMNKILKTNKRITKVEKMDRMFHNYGRFLMDVSKLNNIYPLTDWRVDLKEFLRHHKC